MDAKEALSRTDDAIGHAIERAVQAHHRRRLTRIGHGGSLDPPGGGWASGEPAPREGNAVEILVDGEHALPRIAAAIEQASASVHLAGWYFSPGFRLRGAGTPMLRELLAAAAERVDVRVLAWAGAPLPFFHPDRGEVRTARDDLAAGTRIRYALDDRERPMHCHHEKLVIVDDRLAFVGGIDLTSNGGDRFDTSEHPARNAQGWHDAAAQLEGPAVGDVAEHFRLRWHEVTGERLAASPPPGPAGRSPVQVVRTVPEKIYDGLPRGDFRIVEVYLAALRSAERLIYLESQFLWSPELVSVLVEKLRRPPADDFRLVVLLPLDPNNGGDDTRGQLGQLVEADGDVGRLLACSLHQTGGADARPVYVHAKIGIVDDRWLTIGSANLNEHSFFNDTEMNLVIGDPELARATRLRLWSEHLERPAEELEGDPTEIVDEIWRPLAEEQLALRRRGEPQTKRLTLLPHVSKRTRAFLGPINALLVDG